MSAPGGGLDDRVRFPFGESEEGAPLESLASDEALFPASVDRPTPLREPPREGPRRGDTERLPAVAPDPAPFPTYESTGETPLFISGQGVIPPEEPARARAREPRDSFDSMEVSDILPSPLARAATEGEEDEDDDELALGALDRLVGLWTGDWLWIVLSAAGLLLGPLLLTVGWDFYGASLAQRQGHPWERLLGSGSGLGLSFGIAGSGLFLLNLTYVLRRRFGLLAKWISLRLWLNLHFVCGLTGGSLILVHSGLYARNWPARVSSAAIAVAILSGLFGRYVLTHLPRHGDGDAADRGELARHLARLRRRLRRKLEPYPRMRQLAFRALGESPSQEDPRRGVGFAAGLLWEDLQAALAHRRLASELRAELREEIQDPRQLAKLSPMVEEVIALAKTLGSVDRRLAQLEGIRDLMDSWRAVHLILAVVMVATMGLHVTIVLTYSQIALFGS